VKKDMGIEYICKAYNVPAKRGGRVKYLLSDGIAKGTFVDGTIVGTDGAYLRIKLDGSNIANNYHPTWNLEYI
jgi:hypothetical protein